MSEVHDTTSDSPGHDPVAEAAPPVNKTKAQTRGFTPQRLQLLANTLTIFVALAAIALSIWEGLENRLHNRLSVMPHLERAESTIRNSDADSTYTMTYALSNTGLGPAVLHNVVVFRDDEPIFDAAASEQYLDFTQVRRDLLQLPFSVTGLFTHERRAGEMLRAGADHLVMHFEVPVADSLSRWLPGIVRAEVMHRYSFLFCYCSVYGSHCDSAFLSAPPPPGSHCPR